MAATAFCVPFTPCISEPRARPCICVSRGALRSPIRLKKPLQLLSFHNSNTYVLHKKPSVRCHSSSSSSYESVEDKFSGEFFFRQIFVTENHQSLGPSNVPKKYIYTILHYGCSTTCRPFVSYHRRESAEVLFMFW
eukprot:TRINITY_DN223_c0_g1_i10.p1 TRINITY_DN223_c0_g1~~TRINITY_DN223_c0_g1_i10.p1  ORF type:complete len:136 (+),score=11.34 TRINITY_DN223_c0_g1_i10:157-564(+)